MAHAENILPRLTRRTLLGNVMEDSSEKQTLFFDILVRSVKLVNGSERCGMIFTPCVVFQKCFTHYFDEPRIINKKIIRDLEKAARMESARAVSAMRR